MKPLHHSLRGARLTLRSRAAFTLAESLFAMTIVSFVLLAIIGMMPAGLGALRDSEKRAAESRICQTMLADYEGRSWINLATQPDVITFFDEQGIASSSQGSDNTTKAPTFAVRAMLIEKPEGGQVAMASKGLLPGEGSASPFLRYVRIAITSNALDGESVNQLQAALQQGGNTQYAHVYTFLIANLEPEKGQPAAPP